MKTRSKVLRKKFIYISPKITTENLSTKLFTKRSLVNEINDFNLLAATEADCDGY